MRSFSKAWAISIAVCIAICCGVTTVANAALLRDVRVGEHKNFTRLAFEFDSITRYSKPVLKDKDTISVTFLKSKTSCILTRSNLKRRTRHFNTVVFDQRGSDLTASVTVAYPNFEIKSFSLLGPHRIVIDVYWLDAPLQATVAPPPVLQNVKKPAPLASEETGPKHTKKITASPKPQKRDVPVMTKPEKIAKMPEGAAAPLEQPDKVAISRPSQTTIPGTIQPAQVAPRYSRLQLYLLVVLIALNITIIVSFVIMSRSRLRRTEFSEYDEDNEIADALADALAVQDSTVAYIDGEIREIFQKYKAL